MIRFRTTLVGLATLSSLLFGSCATADSGAGASARDFPQAFPNPQVLHAALTESYDSAAELLAAIEDNETLEPEHDREKQKDNEWRTLYSRQQEFYKVRAFKLIGDLAEEYPDTPELEELLLTRFEYAPSVWRVDLESEVEEYARRYSDNKSAVEKAYYYLGYYKVRQNYRKPEPILAAVNSFENRYPDSEHLEPLYGIAISFLRDLPEQEQITDRMIAKFPESRVAQNAERERKMNALIGTRLELEFTDVLSGREVSFESLRGKVVVVDFWATWCGPCVSEIPQMKALYEKWRTRGVEFVGISLDQTKGRVVAFCEENGVEWPQYCEEGKAWDTEFSSELGISSIPTIFVLDKQGRVDSVKARGRVEAAIQEAMR
jgi:thiol-disulfide isomerase/thioredoxin